MWLFSLRNAKDVRSIGICSAKYVLLLMFWKLYPAMGFLGCVVASFVMSLSCFYVATIVHNAMHRDVFATKNVECIWRIWLSATFGFPVEAYKPTHNMNHHVHTQMEEDHLHTSQMKYKNHLLNLLLFFPTVFPGIQKLEKEWLSAEFKKRSAAFFFYVQQSLAAHGFTALLILADWRRGLALWFVPNILGVDMIITMNMLQHDGCEPVEPGKHRGDAMNIDCARNFVGPVINWLTCNNGFHTIHHMQPQIHWSEYPALHQKIVVGKMIPSLDEQCILRYLWRTYFWPGTLPAHRQEAAGKTESNAEGGTPALKKD